ncbi:MAG: hypothetical protein WBA82_03645 [Castellaniella sp.]|uniref:hypothetical protein n=1 Tax=Castellaniella sp. TaxID=1955812 RepID=UPI003C70926A
MTMLRLALASALLASTAFASGTASAADRKVTVINKTKTVMTEFHASRASTSDWEEDILGSDMLKPGQSITINIDDGTGACVYDFKGTFDDDEELVQNNVNVCKVGEFSFTE